MQIIHKISDILIELFPRYRSSNNDLEILKDEVFQYYTYGAYTPKVSLDGDYLIIDIDVPSILSQETDYLKVVSLSEKGEFIKAKNILIPLIDKNPTNSEYHRILGQIYSEEGNQEEAINSLIDSLKWNPKNEYALLMMGNIFAKHKNDIETAMKYHTLALEVNPNNHIGINNIGVNLLNNGKVKEGIEYLEKAYAINPNYPNTSYGLCIVYEKQGMDNIAFDYAVKCMKSYGEIKDQIYDMALTHATNIAKRLCKLEDGKRIIDEYKSFLERKAGKEVRIEKDASLVTAAKIEFAENHEREFHLVKYKPDYVAVEHLIIHELIHLEFAIEARDENTNMLFTTGREMKLAFMKDNEKELIRLRKEQYSAEVIDKYINSIYEGINSQIFNTPIDLFIEDYIFENYPELHPYQFISLLQLVNEGQTAVTDNQAVKLAPTQILKISKILNIINAKEFKDLYGVDTLTGFKALPIEMKQVEAMWAEYLDYRKDRKPGEEYELIKHWGEDLKLDKYFELIDEQDYLSRPKSIDEILKSAEIDPFGLDVNKNFKEKETEKFLQSQNAIGTNPAVTWFMVDALDFFKPKSREEIKVIAFEIAMIGTHGINPATGNSYKVASIKGKEFSGYNLLAYYYVSWKLAIPEMLSQLNLPYDKEYELALTLYKNKS